MAAVREMADAAGGPAAPPALDARLSATQGLVSDPARSGVGLRYVRNRLLQAAVVLTGAVLVSFVLANLAGNPADVLGSAATPQQRAAIVHQLGYDKPLGERLVHYVAGVAHGDFGTSYVNGAPALSEVLDALPNTLLLVFAAVLLALAITLPLTVFGVLRRGSKADNAIRGGSMVLQGVPDFWLALLLTTVFAVELHLLPSIGFSGPSSLVLPVLAIGLPVTPSFMRLLRGELLDVMEREFITAARAKGLSNAYIVWHHGLRNAAPRFVTLLALQTGWLVGGTIIVETVFAWPGIGSLLVSSVGNRDVVVVQAVVVVVAAVYVLLNLLADLLVIVLDPRIRIGAR